MGYSISSALRRSSFHIKVSYEGDITICIASASSRVSARCSEVLEVVNYVKEVN